MESIAVLNETQDLVVTVVNNEFVYGWSISGTLWRKVQRLMSGSLLKCLRG